MLTLVDDIKGEMEEARALLDSAERGKRQTEAELAESRAAVNEMNTINSKVGSSSAIFSQLSNGCKRDR